MKKMMKRGLALLLTVLMLMSMICVSVFAEETEHEDAELPNAIWYGDELSVDVVAGEEGYNYMSIFRKPAHGYEFSGHHMGTEGPQTFIIIDTEEYAGTTWNPSGQYVSGESNYEVVYCCDVETMIVDGIYYKRLNLEDSEYFDVQADKLRAVVTNSYPYISMEEMIADLKADGFEGAEELQVGDVIAAVQTAIWACANDMEPLRYVRSYNVLDNYQWGQPLNDISELSGLDVSGYRQFKVYEEVGKRIDSLVDYLLEREEIHADTKNAVVTDLEIVGFAPVMAKDGVYTVVVKAELNHSGREGDDLAITLSIGDNEVVSVDVIPGTTSLPAL